MTKDERIKALEERIAVLEARLAAVEARPVAAPVIQPWSPNRPDGTAKPYSPYQFTPLVVSVS